MKYFLVAEKFKWDILGDFQTILRFFFSKILGKKCNSFISNELRKITSSSYDAWRNKTTGLHASMLLTLKRDP